MTPNSIIDLGMIDLLAVYAFALLSIGLGRLKGMGQGRELVFASLRMVFQLLLVGYVLKALFAVQNPWLVLLILFGMGLFAVQTIGARVRQRMPRFYRIVGFAVLVGCGGSTFFLCHLVIQVEPWYDPRYLIPLAGMIIGNSMTGASLAAERLSAEMKERGEEIEAALCLGATAVQAARPAVENAFRAALIPTVNAMVAMGLVFLPGMMTGQILSGTEPVIAVKYQIAIMCVITGSVVLTSLVILLQGFRSYFSDAQQFLPEGRGR